tara:strand:- start:876 stop:2303 length:1428 start_codon:yes stop_codon:yes gene_type:complete
MIKLFSKKKINTNSSKNIKKIFPWLTLIDDAYSNLCNQDINIRIQEILALNTYFRSENGIKQLETLQNKLISKGFPKDAVNIEINYFLELFQENTLFKLLYNESAGLHLHLKDKKFINAIQIKKDFGIIRASIGKVFIVGSANTFLPVLTSLILSYIAGNVTVIQLSSLHKECIPEFIESTPSALSNNVFFTNLSYENKNDLSILEELITSINWNVLNVWGGNESLTYYNKIIAKNINRPRIVNMEPLTGAVLIQRDYFDNNYHKNIEKLSYSIDIMGQQLCSSPTIGFLINEDESISNNSFLKDLIISLEKRYTPNNYNEKNSINLDRMINIARDNGSKVYISKLYGNNICIIESSNESVFINNDSNNLLNIHERRNFLEFIRLKNFSKIPKIINKIFSIYSYKETKKIQTILSFGDNNFDKEVHKLAQLIGAYRIIDSDYVLKRHPMETLDNFNLFLEFTNTISITGSRAENL